MARVRIEGWFSAGVAAGAALTGAALLGHRSRRHALADAERAYVEVLDHAEPPARRFDRAQTEPLPEIARRYFGHAIAPGTPLYSTVEVSMGGIFLLGDKGKFQSYRMAARQVLRPPDQFVWIPELRSGPVTITGSDALVAGTAWTRFWMLGLLPVANDRSSPDLVRSARFRAAIEGALWLPPSLLPENGVEWNASGPDTATVVFKRVQPEPIVLTLTLAKSGAVQSVLGQRWSNANRERRFRLQPFGGTVADEETLQGLTVPTRVAVGNHFGTDDYLPFFQATVTSARYR